MMITELQNYNL